ncbi:MAG: nucleotidyltransferase domain-containing protein [Candidatus Korarchaeota archaeon]|nr:nucleotidyltransferase domain-containing protein [Candidatus Korarchaeota archaeon]
MQEINEIIRAIREWDPEARIILFGSRARGEHLKYSDYDLIVVSKRFEGIPFIRRSALLLKHLYRRGIVMPLELLCYTTEEFERKKEELGVVREAVSYGVEL